MIKPWLHFLTKNLPYKLTALFLAGLIWYVVQGEEILEIPARVEVEIISAEGMMVREPKNHLKDITLRGPRVLLGDLGKKNLQATIKIPSDRRGNMRFRVDKDLFPNWDNRIRMTIHDPAIAVFVDEKIVKTLTVRPDLIGEFNENFTFNRVILRPSEVTLTGLKTDLAKIKEIQTEPIDISNLHGSTELSVKLSQANLPDGDLSHNSVIAVIEVSPKITAP